MTQLVTNRKALQSRAAAWMDFDEEPAVESRDHPRRANIILDHPHSEKISVLVAVSLKRRSGLPKSIKQVVANALNDSFGLPIGTCSSANLKSCWLKTSSPEVSNFGGTCYSRGVFSQGFFGTIGLSGLSGRTSVFGRIRSAGVREEQMPAAIAPKGLWL